MTTPAQDVPTGAAPPTAPSPGTPIDAGQGRPTVDGHQVLELREVSPTIRKAIAHERRPLTTVIRGDVEYLVYLAGTKQSLVIDRIAQGEIRSGLIALEELVDFIRAGERS